MSKYLLATFLLFFVLAPGVEAKFENCSDGWEVTGYYLPFEEDFSGAKMPVETIEEGEGFFREDFVSIVGIEGSGRTEDGRILEWWGGAWHINDRPEDYFGNELTPNTAAVDPELIPFHSRLLVPTLQAPFNTRIYSAEDIGPSIKGKHIDVFMGYGKNALDEAWKFPDYNTLCLEGGAKQISNFNPVLAGRILIQTEKNGEAWYVSPTDSKRYFLGRPLDAFLVMQKLALGVTHDFFSSHKIFPSRLRGRIILDTEDYGRAYYIDGQGKAVFLGRPRDAFRIMKEYGLGASNEDIEKIRVGNLL